VKQLNFELKNLCKRNRDGSFATQANRERILTLIANQLDSLGFRRLGAGGLKPKHIEALVKQWQEAGLSEGTIKNRMCQLRWWAEKIGRGSIIAASNDHYGIEKRTYVTNLSKARSLDKHALDRIADPFVKMSLRLQQVFGLRREEAIKFNPGYADRGDCIMLKPSWTKGGRAREIPVRTLEQRHVLDDAKALAGRGSLIPADRTYIQQLRRYEDQTAKAGIDKAHGLRHAYAQERYLELTGRKAPAAGGSCSKDLAPVEKTVDQEARLRISAELGHEREQITAVYLGR
jgi:hypothetical protein